MNLTLILILGGLMLGCAAAGVFGLYILLSRPYRKARNRLVILLGQVFVGVSALTSLVVLQKLEQFFSVVRHSSADHSAMYAYVLGLLCGAFFVLRAEFRWRRASGLVNAAKKNPPVVPGARRRLLILLGILALSASFSVVSWLNWPKPIAVIFGSISLFFYFAAMIFLGGSIGGEKMREMRTVIFVLATAIFCLFGALAWKFRKTDPAISSAWLVTLAVPCVVALLALVFLRSSTNSTPSA